MAAERTTTDADARPEGFRAMPHAGENAKRKRLIRRLLRRFNLAVLACILVLAILLGILNNLRVADERKVKWFETPDAWTGQNAAGEEAP